ncbi:MAG: hypothetical protein IJY08_03020 [Clostridia bacterium]|nr:hypothetical protein [Clostridia bacterium]
MKTLGKIMFIIACLLLCAAVFVACGGGKQAGTDDSGNGMTDEVGGQVNTPALAVEDQEAVEDMIAVSYAVPDDIIGCDSFRIDVYHGENLICSTEVEKDRTDAIIETTYGNLTFKLVGKTDEGDRVLVTDTARVWADEYNVASLNATFPVVYFTLDMFSMGEEETPGAFAEKQKLPIMADVPTFISLERADAYSWDKLPDNVHAYPNMTEEERIDGSFGLKNERVAAYIKELYDINPESTFNFYCVDNYPELILGFFTVQGIPDESFHATMISDGTGTAVIYKSIFEDADSMTEYDKMVTEWERIKAKAAEGNTRFLDDAYNRYTDTYSILATYPLVIASVEDNVDWWCSRDLFTGNTKSEDIKGVVAKLKDDGKMKIFGINDMLSILYTEDQRALKELFHFDAEMFADATEAGKKALVIIGSSPSAENGELEGFVELLKKTYGDEYMLYYKGHPGYPVELDSEKNAMFERCGIKNLDASIAAELIMFYCPDIYLVGWGSTTFKSVQQGKFLALFNFTEAEGKVYAEEQGYPDLPDMYFKTVTENGKTYISVEYSDGDTVKYYDVAAGTIVDKT